LLEGLIDNDVLFVDVDDTLIAPKDAIFRHVSGKKSYAHFLDELKEQYQHTSGKEREYFEQVLGTWRTMRQIQLVEDTWPVVLETLRAKGVRVYGLTKLGVGSCGPIENIENWRVQELMNLKLSFTKEFDGSTNFKLNIKDLEQHNSSLPVFKEGIFFTGDHEKSDLLSWIFNKNSINVEKSKIVILDDRSAQLEAIALNFNKIKNIHLYHYRAAAQLKSCYDPNLFKWQIERLMQDKYWYSDAEAKKILALK
jgi:hypothetical protein